MLRGKITAKLDNGVSYVYTFVGEDTPTSIYGKVSSYDYDALHFLAGDFEDENALMERKVIINLNSIKVSRATYTDSNGKLKKYEINHDFFLKLGALIRYAKTMCSQSNADGSFGLGDASGEFVAEPITKYVIPMGTTNKTLGTVELRLGVIYSMYVENDSFKVELEEDGTLPEEIFGKIKNTSPKGFMFSEDFLDFPVKMALDSQNLNGLYRDLAEVIAAHPEKELEWLLTKEYYIVTDDMLDSLFEEFMNTQDYVYFDTETTGLNINFKSRIGQADQCVGIILSKDDGISYFFPIQMKAITNLYGGDHFLFMEKFMKPILESKNLVAHNASFDWKVAYIYDINANIVDDTMAMIALTLAEERENFPMALKESSMILLHRDSLELSDLVVNNDWGESDVKFWDLPEELARVYACPDTDNTRGIHRYMLDNDILQKYNATRVYRIEVQFTLAVAYQEFYGHRVDVEHLAKLKEEITSQINREMEKMVEIVGHPFNPNSSPQLVRIMYEELGIPTQISRKTGRPTTDKETLKDLSERTDINGNPMYPFAVHLAKYREAEGIRKIISQYDTLATSDGYLFSQVMQYGTTTGRVSINKPNYQSYNDAVKKYVCPRPGFYMFDTDYSSVEYRVLANMAGNENIKQGFVDPDFDYHAYQAARMYNVPYAAVTSTLRKAAKGINFGIPYGMGDESLGVRVYGSSSAENTAKAAKLRAKYFEGQDDIRDFFDNVRDGGVSNGYTETYFGRRRYYRKSKFTVNAIRRQAGNAVIQGTAADIYKLAVGRVFARICKEGWLGKVLLSGFIHDELLGEVHRSIDPMKFLKALREEFEVAIKGWCPLYMGFGFGMSWYEAKKTEIPIQLQWEMVDQWGENGYPNWHQDGYELYQDVLVMLRDFSVRHCANQISSEDAQGKEIKPATNSALVDVCKTDEKLYVSKIKSVLKENGVELSYPLSYAYDKESFIKAVEREGFTLEDVKSGGVDENIVKSIASKAKINFDIPLNVLEKDEAVQIVLRNNVDSLNDMLHKEFITGVIIRDNVVILDLFSLFNITLKSKKDTIDTQLALDLFCGLHGIDRQTIDVRNIDVSTSAKDESVVLSDVLTFDDDEAETEEQRQAAIDQRVRTLGMYLDTENSVIILQLLPAQWLELLRAMTTKEKRGYLIRFRDYAQGKDFITETYVPYDRVTNVQSLYIRYLQFVQS